MPAKTVFLPVMNPSGARGERGNGGKAPGHDAVLFASERRDEREIVRRRELLRWGCLPAPKQCTMMLWLLKSCY
jgi:hypothetical protein